MTGHLLKALALAALLAGCGADGEPIQPTMNAVVGLSEGGSYTAGSVGLNRGPVSFTLGF